MSVIWIVIYGIIYSFSEKFGENHILAVFPIMLYIVVLYMFLKKRKRLSVYGLCLPKYWRKKDVGWLMPLLSFPFANMYLQGNQTMLQNSWIMFLLMLFTVFLEELLFRGYLLVYLFEKCGIDNKWIGMIISSVLFGMFHIVNLFQGADISYTMIQMLCACGIGLCLCVLVSQYKSIFPGVIVHYLINITSFDMEKSNYHVLLFFFILSVLHIFYACLLKWKWRTI
ncbi:CPBP family intramembrane glutamic endopeptidase [Clostridium omnivorum]|uniref:CPBP family intramembrane glutamic endopeptidase n=1 Tax=Clostridium omnivorum TaxID=1604902 RepID=UPI002852C97F|nr:CPBP family intramembrane glutamic endopeptidase [Clostridium sp. E14]